MQYFVKNLLDMDSIKVLNISKLRAIQTFPESSRYYLTIKGILRCVLDWSETKCTGGGPPRKDLELIILPVRLVRT